MRRGIALVVLVVGLAGCRTAESWYRRGQHAEKPELKLQYYSRVLELEPDHPGALRERGAVLVALGRSKDGIADLDRSLAREPGNARAHSNRGVAWLRLGEREKARTDLARAIHLDPRLAEAHDALGRLLEEEGKLEPALAAYGRAIEADPELATAWFDRGRLQFRRGDLESARQDYQKAIQHGDVLSQGLAFRDLALTWLAAGQPGPALDVLQQGLRAVPEMADLVYLSGAMLYVGGKFKNSGQLIARAHLGRYQHEYCYLFLSLATQRVYKTPHRVYMKRVLAGEATERWPRPLIEAYAGSATEEQALAAARTPDERAEAGYFLGELALIEGKTEAAARYFALSAAAPAPFIPERHLARLRLAELRER